MGITGLKTVKSGATSATHQRMNTTRTNITRLLRNESLRSVRRPPTRRENTTSKNTATSSITQLVRVITVIVFSYA